MDLEKLLNTPTVFVELIKILPPCGLLLLIIFFVLRFQRPLAELLSRIGNSKRLGLKHNLCRRLTRSVWHLKDMGLPISHKRNWTALSNGRSVSRVPFMTYAPNTTAVPCRSMSSPCLKPSRSANMSSILKFSSKVTANEPALKARSRKVCLHWECVALATDGWTKPICNLC